MKVAIVAHGITDQSLLGGPGRVAAEHAKGLARAGHDVMVCTTNLIWKGRRVDPPTFSLLGGNYISVRWTKAYSMARWPGSLGPVVCVGGRRMLREAVEWADVVHAHEWPHELVQSARRLSLRAGKGFVVQPHGSIQLRPRGWKELSHRGFNYMHRITEQDHFIAGTSKEEQDIATVLGRTPTFHRLGNPVTAPDVHDDDERVARWRHSWGFPEHATALLFAHRIVPNKGLDIAIRALDLLPANYCLAVVGQDGGYAAYSASCRALVDELRLGGRVHFAGPVGRTEVDEVMLASDIFLLPARHDIFPLMVMHALACKRPVVMTNTCQSSEELIGSAIIVEPEPAPIADAIRSLTAERATALVRSGIELMKERYSSEAVIAHLTEIYGDVCSRPRPVRG